MEELTPDVEEYLGEQFDKYGFIGVSEVGDVEFAWRRLTRGEYNVLSNLGLSPLEKEEWLCRKCVVYPFDYDFGNCTSAGIPTTLSRDILKGSYFVTEEDMERLNYLGEDSPGKKLLLFYREEMELYENQIDCIIAEAFSKFSIEEIGDWPVDKTMLYLSRAEWTLRNLRCLPSVEVSKKPGTVNDPAIKPLPTTKSIQRLPGTRQ